MTLLQNVLVSCIIGVLVTSAVANGLFLLTSASSDNTMRTYPKMITSAIVTDNTGRTLEAAVVGQTSTIQVKISDVAATSAEHGSPADFTVILDIRDESSMSVNIQWQSTSLTTENNNDLSFIWKPDGTGKYSFKVFVISSFEQPEILSAPSVSLITIVDDLDQPDRPYLEGNSTVENQDNLSELADYTILVYMVGSDLESNGYFGSIDISEMKSVKTQDNINVIIETGGAQGATIDNTRSIDFTKVQRHRIHNGQQELLVDLGTKNMGESDTLAEFMKFGVEQFPAHKYVIVLWNDGSGINGFGTDTVSEDILTLEELQTAFSESKKSNGIEFELIGFDACLMATYEVITRLDSYGKFMVASQELEPGWGWDYAAILQSLNGNPQQTGAELGRVIADSYSNHVGDNANALEDFDLQESITLSVIDLSKIDRIDNDFALFSIDLEQRMNSISASQSFAKGLLNTERFGFGSETTSGHWDLYDLARNGAVVFPELLDSSQELQNSIDEAVIYSVSGEFRSNSYGMSVYVPIDESSIGMDDGMTEYSPARWANIIYKYRSYLDSDHAPPSGKIYFNLKDKVLGELESIDAYRVELFIYKEILENTAAQIVSYIDDYVTVDTQGKFEYPFNKEFISLCNATECVPVMMYIESSAQTKYAIFPVRLESAAINTDVSLIYHFGGNRTFGFIGAWPGIDDEGNASRELWSLQNGDKIYVKSYQFDIRPGEQYNKFVELDPIVVSDGFGPAYKVHSGLYHFSAGICDYSGNCKYTPDYIITNNSEE